MEFKHIKETECKCCGRGIKSQTISHRHTNGNWNEYIEFECGRKLHFSPNYMDILIDKECPKNREEQIKNGKRDKFYQKIISTIENYKLVDKKEKMRVLEGIRYTVPGANDAKKRIEGKDNMYF